MAVSPLSLIRGIKYTSIDFGHNSIKYLNSRVKNGKFKLLASGRREIPTGTIENGKVIDTHLLTKIVGDIFDEKNMNPGVLLVTPAPGQEFVRNIKMPKMPKEELQEALIWEVQDFLDLEPEEIALDYIVLEEKAEELDLLVTVISKEVLNSYLELFNNNMLKVKVFNLEDMALISLLAASNQLTDPALILDIGTNKSKILIAAKNKFYLSREVGTSAQDFTNLFLEGEADYQKAEIRKKKFKFFPEQAEETEEPENLDLMLSEIETTKTIQKQVKNLADEIIFEINRSLEYHNERYADSSVNKLYLTGGGLLLNGLVDYFKTELDNEIALIKPLEKFYLADNINQINNYFLATTAGTIISEVKHNES
ncbi:pilus assembly protein PilM [Halanaerobium praevalens]|uniref:Type IV pilus assembly protein PilM n=1 Tax=Halanaerobium praevalens (strain ATCC 33744 / DSM 2228 / GSL) TaxID=572479 RepID=E3DR97_HALPG|nr:pilus assembly protein PilM [Halanaerobium praevalens]ADO77003.1 type IV pilus assembly protein PilM [Halanaerobium praevalens DSM 2228]